MEGHWLATMLMVQKDIFKRKILLDIRVNNETHGRNVKFQKYLKNIKVECANTEKTLEKWQKIGSRNMADLVDLDIDMIEALVKETPSLVKDYSVCGLKLAQELMVYTKLKWDLLDKCREVETVEDMKELLQTEMPWNPVTRADEIEKLVSRWGNARFEIGKIELMLKMFEIENSHWSTDSDSV